MKEIRNLVRIYDELLKNKTSKFIRKSFNPKEESLFNYYLTNVSENKIAKELYNSGPSHQSFQSLKRSLLEKLYSIIISANVVKSYQKQRLDVGREYLVVKALSFLKMRSLMISLSEKTLHKCIKLHQYNEAAELARLLSEHYSVFSVKRNDAVDYYELSLKCNKIFAYEIEYGWIYSKIRGLYGTPEFEKSVDRISEVADEIKDLFHLNSSRLAYYYYDLRFFEYYILKDFDAMVTICKEAIAYFESLKFNHELARHLFMFHLIEVYLIYNDFDNAKFHIHEFLDQASKKDASYYRYKELLLRIHLYQADLDESVAIYNFLKASTRKSATIYYKDRLIIYEMYLSLLSGKGLNFRKIKYNINKIKKDKKGMHVPYLIGQAIYYYINEPDTLIDKLDALNQYVYKYLKGDEFLRTRQFIKILNRIMDSKPYDDLEITVPQEKVHNYGLEMVSYEHLLKLVEQHRVESYNYV